MAPPPATGAINKRKRAASNAKAKAVEPEQADSSPAPSTSKAGTGRHSRGPSKESIDPPTKRARVRKMTGSSTTAALDGASDEMDVSKPHTRTPKQKQTKKQAHDGDQGSDVDLTNELTPADQMNTSEAVINTNGTLHDEAGHELSGAEVSQRLAPPGRAGLIDPAGYKTNPPPVGRPVRVYADGVFDLFHLGHMRALEQAKKAFPNTILVAGVTSDADTHARKGLTVLTGEERVETVRHCKWVDEVIPDSPWILDLAFLDEHKIDYVAHDDLPYGAAESDDIYKEVKMAGRFLVTQRTEGLSTTGIITKIVRDYDKYIERQLSRGTDRRELNVSWLKKNELDLKRQVGDFRKSIRGNWTAANVEVNKDLKGLLIKGESGEHTGDQTPETPGKDGVSTPSKHADGVASPASHEFATGYTYGLIASVKSWMAGRPRALQAPSRPETPAPAEKSHHARHPSTQELATHQVEVETEDAKDRMQM